MTGPTESRRPGRHAAPEAGARPAAELLADLARGRAATLERDDTGRLVPRRTRRAGEPQLPGADGLALDLTDPSRSGDALLDRRLADLASGALPRAQRPDLTARPDVPPTGAMPAVAPHPPRSFAAPAPARAPRPGSAPRPGAASRPVAVLPVAPRPRTSVDVPSPAAAVPAVPATVVVPAGRSSGRPADLDDDLATGPVVARGEFADDRYDHDHYGQDQDGYDHDRYDQDGHDARWVDGDWSADGYGADARHWGSDDVPDDHPDLADTGRVHPVFDETGGLEVIVDDEHPDDVHDDGGSGGRGRRRGGGGRGDGGRRRRRPVAVVVVLLVLAVVAGGLVVGGHRLVNLIDPGTQDYAGAGTGSADIKIDEGDSLRAIAAHMVAAKVIASSGPFVDAARSNPAATAVQPGTYRLHQHMSGRSALELLLDPTSRITTRVTVREGLTAAQTLQMLADKTGTPLADLQAAARDTAAIGLPAYANGLVEGFLYPATYDFEPGVKPVDMLKAMVTRAVTTLDQLQIPVDQRLSVVTEASMVQAEAGSVDDMGKVARVLDNRMAQNMPLQLDTTVNYANGKAGVTTTAQDRANPSPYNTYVHTGLPPGAISNPGEEALKAVLDPTPGNWLFFVVVDPTSGETRFADTAEEHSANVKLFQQWLAAHPNG